MAKTMPWGEVLKVELDVGYIADAFTLDSSTLDGPQVLDGTSDFVDITEYVTNVNITRGRSDQLSTFGPGICTIVADDRAANRQFDPANTASPWYLNDLGIAPRRFMRVYAGTAGDEPLWYGRVNDLDIEYSQPNISFVSISGVDDLSDFAKSDLLAFTPTQTTPQGRFAEILDRPEVAYSTATRSLSTACVATLGTVAYGDNVNAKSALDAVAQAEDGRFFVSKDPTVGVVLQPRISFSFDTPTLTFSDVAGTAIPYQNLSVGFGAETLINRVQVGVQGHAIATAVGTASIAQYGVSALALNDVPLSSTAQGESLAANLLAKYEEPVSRFNEIEILLNGLTLGQQESLAELEIGDVIAVTKTYAVGSPSVVTQNVFIERIQHQINPQAHRMVLGLGQAQLLTQFILDTSELDDSTVGLG
jgi:hypothetical protein